MQLRTIRYSLLHFQNNIGDIYKRNVNFVGISNISTIKAEINKIHGNTLTR